MRFGPKSSPIQSLAKDRQGTQAVHPSRDLRPTERLLDDSAWRAKLIPKEEHFLLWRTLAPF